MATITDDTDTTDLGDTQSERLKKDSGLIPMPLPDSTSNETVLMPITGPVNYISVTGKKTGLLDSTAVQDFIDKLDKWVTDGGKVSKNNVTFVGDVNPGPFSVRVITAAWSNVSDEPFIVNWTIEMVEGTF